MKKVMTRILAIGLVFLFMMSVVPQQMGPGFVTESTLPTDEGTMIPDGQQMALTNFTNNYQEIWEPNKIQGSSHAVDASPDSNLVVVAGGYLSDAEVHIYRWHPDHGQYMHVWDSGDQIITSDVLDVKFMDADNNGRLEIVAACADGSLMVFEALAEETGEFSWWQAADIFELVWDSGEIMRRQLWEIDVGDADHDGQSEILVASWDGKMYLFDYVDHSAWPYCSSHWMDFELVWTSGDVIPDRVNTVTMADTNGNGRVELIGGSQDCKVYIFEEIPCLKHTYNYTWDSGELFFWPINSIDSSPTLDSDALDELVVSAYGQGTMIFHYLNEELGYFPILINRGLEAWEQGSVPQSGVYTGFEADIYGDRKTYGWNAQGIYEYDLPTVPYPWNHPVLGGESALGGPPDHNVTTFDPTPHLYYLGTLGGVLGQLPGEFYVPWDIEFSPLGFMYVTDANNDRIQMFTWEGEFLHMWGEKGADAGQFDEPSGIAVDAEGFVYVCDTWNNRIQKFTFDGEYIAEWGGSGIDEGHFSTPRGIDVGPDGMVLVADTMHERIQVFSPDGEFLYMWGTEGDQDGQFKQPHDVASDIHGNVYVADKDNDRVQKFTSDGTFILKWGTTGADNGQFVNPSGIAVDNEGNVYVTDQGTDRLQKFGSEGTTFTEIGNSGLEHGQFNNPLGVAVSPTGALHIVDASLHRIEIYGIQTFSLLQQVSSHGHGEEQIFGSYDLDFGPDGNIYIADTGNDAIKVFAPDGSFLRSWDVKGEDEGETDTPLGITVDDDGFVYVSIFLRNLIQKYSSEGEFIYEQGGAYLSTPVGIDYYNGSLYIADYDNNRVRVLTTGLLLQDTWSQTGTGLGDVQGPWDVVVGPDELLYVSEATNSRIQRFDLDGVAQDYWSGDFSTPYFIDIDPQGIVYVSGFSDNKVYMYTGDGFPTGELVGNEGNYAVDIETITPFAVAIDAENRPWILDVSGLGILQFQPKFSLNRLAEAVVDFGRYEELGGDSTIYHDMILYATTVISEEVLTLALSQDGGNFTNIDMTNVQTTTGSISGYGTVTLILVDVDPVLAAEQWTDFRYLKIGIKGASSHEVDCILGRVARPLDTALVVTIGDIKRGHSGDIFTEIIIGTVDGQLMAYDGMGTKVWESYGDFPRFSLETSIRDIVQLNEDKGMMPTWEMDESLLDEADLVSEGFTNPRILSYQLIHIDGSLALDLVVTIADGTAHTNIDAYLLYFRNLGSNEDPVFDLVDGFWNSHTTGNTRVVFQTDDETWDATYLVVSFADLDNDNDMDMILTRSYWEVDTQWSGHYFIDYFERTGSLTWTERPTEWSGSMPEALTQVDVFVPRVTFFDNDNDGDLDLTMSNIGIWYFENTGTAYSPYFMWDFNYYKDIINALGDGEAYGKVWFHDFDHDNDWDLTVASSTSNVSNEGIKTTWARLIYFENNRTVSHPSWEAQRSIYEPDFRGSPITSDRGYIGPSMADMNDDGVLDLIVMRNDTIDCYYARLDHDIFMVATYPNIHMVEVEKRDDSAGALVNYYDDDFMGYEAYDSWDNSFIMDHWSKSVAIGDTDEDGKNEVVVGSFDNNIIAFEQVANNTYRRSWRSPDLLYNGSGLGVPDFSMLWYNVEDIEIGDQDGDGKHEIIAIAGYSVFVFENIANDEYELVWQSNPLSVTAEGVYTHKYTGQLLAFNTLAVDKDLDNDGLPEILVGAGSYLLVYENIGDNAYNLTWYTALTHYEAGVPIIFDIETGDFEGDGFKDILLCVNDLIYNVDEEITYSQGWVAVFENLNNGSDHVDNVFGPRWASEAGVMAYDASIGNNDKDSFKELYIGTDDSIMIFETFEDNAYVLRNEINVNGSVYAIEACNSDGDYFMELAVGVEKYLLVLEQNNTMNPQTFQFDIVWISEVRPNRITDLVVGDSNNNGLKEVIATTAEGNLYSFEWIVNASSPGVPSFEPASFITSSSQNPSSQVEMCCGINFLVRRW